MTADTLVEQLLTCAPPAEKLREVGLSSDEAEQFRSGYACKRRPDSTSITYANPLIEFVENYDTSQLKIASLRFLKKAERHDSKWRLATLDADFLVLDPATGEVQIEENRNAGYVLWECAENGSKFLDALLVAVRFLGRCSWDSRLYEDQEAHKSAAAECTALAGGNKYHNFYLMLCGCD